MKKAGADSREVGTVRYERYRPQQKMLYRIVERHYPAFVEHLAEAGNQLPSHVRQAFDAYLQCVRLEQGFLRLRSAVSEGIFAPNAARDWRLSSRRRA